MITKTELKEITGLTRLKIHQQERHYIQTIVLSSIYSAISNELIFKGGTSLFFVYNLNRFSNDLDFTLLRQINKEKLINTIKKNLELISVMNDIDQLKETKIKISFRICAEGPLFTKDIEKCYINIEMSKRETVENFEVKEIRPIYPDLLPFSIAVMTQEEIAAEKVRAILMRNYARDVYDLCFLLQRGIKLSLSLINKKLSIYNKQFNKEDFIKKLNEKREFWGAELNPLVIGNLLAFKEAKNLVVKNLDF
ncbi:MAG: nucleotidyl transferase AbiEii/AbiGii toxin family protein [Candidatus Thermoplasmatota archaeon]